MYIYIAIGATAEDINSTICSTEHYTTSVSGIFSLQFIVGIKNILVKRDRRHIKQKLLHL
jgi:hypothetical protein